MGLELGDCYPQESPIPTIASCRIARSAIPSGVQAANMHVVARERSKVYSRHAGLVVSLPGARADEYCFLSVVMTNLISNQGHLLVACSLTSHLTLSIESASSQRLVQTAKHNTTVPYRDIERRYGNLTRAKRRHASCGS
jgi:hypothetical protein